MSENICAACGNATAPWGERYERCHGCGSLRLKALVWPEEILNTYTDPAYHAGSLGESRGAVYHQSRLDLIQEHLRPRHDHPRLLEIGCGQGLFAQAAMGAGYDVEAVEPGARYPDALVKLGDRVHQATWEEFLPEQRGCYDVIAAWEVIEHLPAPGDFAAAAVDALRPDGVLVMSTPNARAWVTRLVGERDPMLCPDEHLQLFSAAGIRWLLSSVTDDISVRGCGYLLPAEIAAGSRRYGKVGLPKLTLWPLSMITRIVRAPMLSLGLEAVARRPLRPRGQTH